MFLFLVILSVSYISAINNGLGRTPPMGWNSWNRYHCDINEGLIKHIADSLVTSGLKDAGYIYVNLDDCWSNNTRVDGKLVGDSIRFPHGIKALSVYLKSRNLRFGIYSDAGDFTCKHRPGSLDHEVIDAQTFSRWGVEYLKYDHCYSRGIDPKISYGKMSDALASLHNPIFFTVSIVSDDTPTWAAKYGNSWRTTPDIENSFGSLLANLEENNQWASYAAPGGFNDPDLLEIGNGRLTFEEEQAHFSLWSIVKAPLLISTDVANLPKSSLSILLNSEVIAVNQDPLGIQGRLVSRANIMHDVYAGKLVNGAYAVVLFNLDKSKASLTAKWSDIGIKNSQNMVVRDLWSHSNLGEFSGSITLPVESHGVRMLKLTPHGSHTDGHLGAAAIVVIVIGGIFAITGVVFILSRKFKKHVPMKEIEYEQLK